MKPELECLFRLLAEDRAFVSFDEDDDTMSFNLICNDTFAWGSADCEEFELKDAETIWNLYTRHGYNGITAWIANKCNIEPLKPLNTEGYKAALKELENATDIRSF